MIQILKQSSKSLKILIDDFTSNNSEKNGKSYDEEKLSIKAICDDILTALKTEIRAKKIAITTDLKVAEIRFPKKQPEKNIVYNLVHNAIKFSDTEQASEIKITTEKVEDYIIFCVVDNGVGIPEEHQRYIYKKSSRLSEKISGTGMGLYVVKTMIEDNEGRIRLQRKEGVGSTFSVFFKQKPE